MCFVLLCLLLSLLFLFVYDVVVVVVIDSRKVSCACKVLTELCNKIALLDVSVLNPYISTIIICVGSISVAKTLLLLSMFLMFFLRNNGYI